MNPLDLIGIYYRPGTLAYRVLTAHSKAVAEAALTVAQRVAHLAPDTGFIQEAAMLHDIGICRVNAPEIGCFGASSYVCHGWLGAQILESHGLPAHARVCERHVGVGLSAEDIARQQLALPVRDMLPETLEEQIICFADLFFSKMPPPDGTRKDPAAVAASLEPWGPEKTGRFKHWQQIFGACV